MTITNNYDDNDDDEPYTYKHTGFGCQCLGDVNLTPVSGC